MYISKIKIKNFKCYKDFSLELNKGLNIIVGDNESGKSTILEAINLALSGYLYGKSIWNEISQYTFNQLSVKDYIDSVNSKHPIAPPEISIEIYFKETESKIMNGDYNSDSNNNAEGFVFQIKFNDDYASEYESLIKNNEIKSIPIEYYEVSWMTFAHNSVTTRSIPFGCILIDSSEYKYQNGQDLYLSKILKNKLSNDELVGIIQAHRRMKESFSEDKSIISINNKLSEKSELFKDKSLKVTVDLGSKNTWESNLVTELNDIPFNYIGKGSQCMVKTDIALLTKTSTKPQIILLEEPENHLSHTNLNVLINYISKEYMGNQILITTHSSFVANKLGLEKIIMLKNHVPTKFSKLSNDTYEFFKKIAGYDTLRLILSKKAILCEGDSDELIIQKAYMQLNNGKLPIEDGIEVISTGISFLRFLEIAELSKAKVIVVTDNDGDLRALRKKYEKYLDGAYPNIHICYSTETRDGLLNKPNSPFNYNTLEPELFYANGLEKINEILKKDFQNDEKALIHMHANKTNCALKFFDYPHKFVIPKYIEEAVTWETN